MAWATHLINLVLPGSGLLACGRGIAGGVVMAGALVSACVLGLVGLGIPLPPHLPLAAAGAYLLIALAGEAWLVAATRVPRLDAPAVRAAHREAAAAYLVGDQARARSAVERLCRLAGHEPGAWRLAALVLDAIPDASAAARARRRAEALEERG